MFVFVLPCIALRVQSSFAINWKWYRNLVTLLELSYICVVTINLFVALPHGVVDCSAVCDCGIS